jgi:hypothetical protein
MEAVRILVRQVAAGEETIQVPLAGTAGHCEAGNEYNGMLGLRISSIFVILIGSLFGMLLVTPFTGLLNANFFEVLVFPSGQNEDLVGSSLIDYSLAQNSLAPVSSSQLHSFM